MDNIEIANEKAIDRIQESIVHLIRMGKASEEIKILSKGKALLHSGPPVTYENMCSAMKNAIHGAIVYEKWANNISDAEILASSGTIEYYSCNDYGAVGPMAGIISPSMPVYVFKNIVYNNFSVVTVNEGLGKTLRFGANDESVIAKLNWIEKIYAPILKETLKIMGPLDVSAILAQGLQRGDEAHNRNKACTSIFIRKIAPYLVKTSFSKEDISDVLAFLDGNDHTFLNLSMGVSKATMDTIKGIANCSLVSCMCTNGYEFGIKVSALKDKWITFKSSYAIGNYFPNFTSKDASPVMGDSYISEASGIGAFAMGCAPGIGQFIGISATEALEYSKKMYEITVAEHKRFLIPSLNYRGVPLGIDIRKVKETRVLPIINTGIAHKNPGVGQIGAGIVYPPIECFFEAVNEFNKSLESF